MANFKIVVSDPKSRRAYQAEVEQGASGLVGKKIGDKAKGDPFGLAGYEVELTGGSDKDGFPMRRDVEGTGRKKIILSGPPGFHPKKGGQRKRRSIRGNTISPQIAQINAKVVKAGSTPFEKLVPKKEGKEAKPEEEKPKEEAKAKEEKPAEKKEEPKAEKKSEEKPKEEPKPEEKKEEKPAKKREEPKAEKKSEEKPKEEKKSEKK